MTVPLPREPLWGVCPHKQGEMRLPTAACLLEQREREREREMTSGNHTLRVCTGPLHGGLSCAICRNELLFPLSLSLSVAQKGTPLLDVLN